jgi:hypothetical protein
MIESRKSREVPGVGREGGRRRPGDDPARAMIRVAMAFSILAIGQGAEAQVAVDGAMHHLGTVGEPEWQEFARDRPEGRAMRTVFRAQANPREATLFLRQRDVKLVWDVQLNGQTIGRLLPSDADLVHTMAVPSGALREGENILEIGPPSGVDDIVVGEIALDPRPRGEALQGATLVVRVSDADSGRGLPCRITVVDDRGSLAPLSADPAPPLAVRPGVAYTADGRARLGLRPGRYTIHATRGFEYGLATRDVTLGERQEHAVSLAIRREVPTPGLVACDTHVHTLTYSGHGDATVEERLVTLAGEGIELPVATDHNHLTDLAGAARRLGLQSALTTVVGDEVTTRRGHFNAFPFDPGGPVPDARIEHWPDLMRAIRAGSTGRVVILNHPRDRHAGFRPFGEENFHPAVGEDRNGVPYGFDAVELINSGAMQTDPMRVVRDWFALWNHGLTITAVGASDSHDVSRSIVGQARTYIACRDDDPGRIDLDEACRGLRAGRALVSLGLLARLSVDDRFGPGDLATGLGDRLRVTVAVLGPSWTRADRVELFADGIKIQERRIDPMLGSVEKARVEWSIPRPPHDVALVAVASGPGVTAPYWPIPRPYQPTSTAWEPRVFAVTNPIRVDADGDGSWSSPRYYAQFLIEIFGADPTALFPTLSRYDEAVATQAAAFCLPEGQGERDPEYVRALKTAPEVVRRGFAAYEESLARRSPDRR